MSEQKTKPENESVYDRNRREAREKQDAERERQRQFEEKMKGGTNR